MTLSKQQKNIGFKRRILIFCAGVAGFAALLVGRLFEVQLVEGAWYAQRAENNRLFSQPIPAERGVFLDRYGDPLTRNIPIYFESLDPNSLFSEKKPLTREDALQLMASGSGAVGYTLGRTTVHPLAIAPVTGYVTPVTAQELERDPSLRISDVTGKLGLEKTFDDAVRGVDGEIAYEVNAQGQKQRELLRTAAQPGVSVRTSIDPYLSEVAYAAMGDHLGAVLIGDADTGELLSLVSAPSYDSSLLGQRFVEAQREQERQRAVSSFFSHPRQLFFNRAVAGQYPLGSVFKLVTALAGLESGTLDPNQTVLDEGSLKVGEDYSYANWYFTQYGRVEGEIALQRAIARSNDIYFYKAAEWVGPERLAQFASLFGFGKKTGIQLPGEVAGLVPDPAWKERTLGERWFLGNTYHFGIGQDNLLVTPVQVVQLLQAVGNQGMLCPATLIEGAESEKIGDLGATASTVPGSCTELGLSEEHLEVVLKGMLDACSEGGTAFPLFAYNATHRDPSLKAMEEINRGAIACKTGTAEFGQADGNGHRRTHAWFGAVVGTADIASEQSTASGSAVSATASAQLSAEAALKDQWRARIAAHGFPRRLVFVVLVESDEAQPFAEGSREAAPVVQRILNWLRS